MNEQIRNLIQLVPRFRDRPVSVSPLGGGLTNSNYRVDVEGESYVLRVAGKDTGLLGIDRECEVACSRAAAALGVGPEVIAYLPEHSALVTRCVPGRILSAETMREPDVMGRVVQSLRRYHDGPPGSGSFSPFVTVRNYYALAGERGVPFPQSLIPALELLARIERGVHTDEPRCPCHNDLLPANFFDDGTTVRIIDWEYGGMGDRFFDLGNLAVNNEFGVEDEQALLGFYFGEVRPDHLRRLHLMRLASDMREAMWGFLQAADRKSVV